MNYCYCCDYPIYSSKDEVVCPSCGYKNIASIEKKKKELRELKKNKIAINIKRWSKEV